MSGKVGFLIVVSCDNWGLPGFNSISLNSSPPLLSALNLISGITLTCPEKRLHHSPIERFSPPGNTKTWVKK
jgi:hypothetical protein